MKITRVKINGLENPVGFGLRKVKVSWNVEEFTGKHQKEAKIEVAKDSSFSALVYEKSGDDLKQYCEILDMALEARTRYYVRITVTADNGETRHQ